MKAIIIVYCILAALGFAFVTLVPLPEPPCNFCSGSGQGEDCPRHDKAAKKACLASVRDHYCGQRPSDCDGTPPTTTQRNFQ
jgi:hypothetical protein